MTAGELIRGLLRSPYASARGFFLRMAVIFLAVAVFAAAATRWLGAAGFAGGSVVMFGFALIAQREAEMGGLVEREQRRRAEILAERAAWPAWKRRAFYGLAITAVVALEAWRLLK